MRSSSISHKTCLTDHWATGNMNAERLTYLLEHPWEVDHEKMEAVRQLRDAYPYYDVPAYLELYYLRQTNDLTYPSRLKEVAALAPDREWLYYFLTQVPQINERATEDQSVRSAEVQQETETTEQSAAVQLDPELEALEREILSSALSYSIEASSKLKEDEEPMEPNAPVEKEEAAEPPSSFNDWLKAKGEAPKQADPAKSIDDYIKRLESSRGPKSAEKPKETQSHDVSGIARKSVEDAEEIVTETLARIYMNQKNYAKARRVYEKLSLLNPEKSGYFASQIKKIDDLS